jgi:hypothetical protein
MVVDMLEYKRFRAGGEKRSAQEKGEESLGVGHEGNGF